MSSLRCLGWHGSRRAKAQQNPPGKASQTGDIFGTAAGREVSYIDLFVNTDITLMATSTSEASQQHWVVSFLPLRTLANAQSLAHRYREVDGFRFYVHERFGLLLPAVLAIALISIACAIGVVVYLADHHSLLALVGILLLPVVLAGSFLVQAYVFFAWIEGRALAHELRMRHRPPPGASARWLMRKFGLDMGPFPPVPWLLAALFVALPLGLLVATWWSFALVAIFVGVITPIAYAKLER